MSHRIAENLTLHSFTIGRSSDSLIFREVLGPDDIGDKRVEAVVFQPRLDGPESYQR